MAGRAAGPQTILEFFTGSLLSDESLFLTTVNPHQSPPSGQHVRAWTGCTGFESFSATSARRSDAAVARTGSRRRNACARQSRIGSFPRASSTGPYSHVIPYVGPKARSLSPHADSSRSAALTKGLAYVGSWGVGVSQGRRIILTPRCSYCGWRTTATVGCAGRHGPLRFLGGTVSY